MDTFERAFAFVVNHEGGYSKLASDPGNWTGGRCGVGECRGTNWGISAAAYPTLNIAALTVDDAQQIYRRDYWERVHGDELPAPLALLVFDAAVNNGPDRAIRWLQSALNATEDGVIGHATLTALDHASGTGADVCAAFQARRLVFMAGLPTWKTFGNGWAQRLSELPFQSMQMG